MNEQNKPGQIFLIVPDERIQEDVGMMFARTARMLGQIERFVDAVCELDEDKMSDSEMQAAFAKINERFTEAFVGNYPEPAQLKADIETFKTFNVGKLTK